MSSEIEDLHYVLFGYRPAKAGTAYERITALVLAVIGWEHVEHDTTETGEGRQAEHQLDVKARHPSGEIRRLIVSCKEWNKTVGKAVMDTLVGVRDQLKADASAVVTTIGYSDGARKVAADEQIAMLRLVAFDPDNPVNYVKKVALRIDPVGSSFENWGVEPILGEGPPGGHADVALKGDDHLSRLDGSPAETLAEVIESQPSTLVPGRYERRADFPEGRLIPTVSGPQIPIAALTWTEVVIKSQGSPIVVEQDVAAEPVLVVQQLDEDGGLEHGRVVVDTDLFAWDIDESGNVTPRGPLLPDEDRKS